MSGRPDPGLNTIVSERRQLINLSADAEDVVQETYARWYAMTPQQQQAIESPGGWLTKVASRAACRQLASSARRRVHPTHGHPTPAAQRADVVRDFRQAWEAKDIDALVGLLDPEATTITDGGGLARARLHPIQGAERIACHLVEILDRASTLTILERTVNGQPGLVAQQEGVTVTVMAFDVTGDRIKHIWTVRNPEKLRPWMGRIRQDEIKGGKVDRARRV